MKEKPTSPITSEHDGIVLPISRRDRVVYKLKDRLGEFGMSIFEQTFDQEFYQVTSDTYTLPPTPKVPLENLRDKLGVLTSEQRAFVEKIISHLNNDCLYLDQKLEKKHILKS